MGRPKSSSSQVNASSLKVHFTGWKIPNEKFRDWAKKMEGLHKQTWKKSGIYEAIKASDYKIDKNESLVLSLAQKWCPETKSFVFLWGEATITLEDVKMLLGFSVLGSSVSTPLRNQEMKNLVKRLERRSRKRTNQKTWIESFENDKIEHEAFLVLWLSKYFFPPTQTCMISKDVFPIAVRLARGERIALAPAVLASLYTDLGRIHDLHLPSNKKSSVYVNSLFKLLQVWIWERFQSLRPEAKLIPEGKPIIARWHLVNRSFENGGLFLRDDFDWCPYAKRLTNWKPPKLMIGDDIPDDDEFLSFARCVRDSKLVGIGVIEDYYPNRVAKQFGLAQDHLPCLDTNQTSNFTVKEAWKDYNKSLNDLKRIARGSAREWWMKSVLKKLKEPIDYFSDSVDHSDDDGVPPQMMPLSQIIEKLRNERRKRRLEDVQAEITVKAEVDDDITIADMIKSRKSSGDAKEIAVEKSSHEEEEEADLNGSGISQKLDETVTVPEIAMKEGEDDNMTISQLIKSRKRSRHDSGDETVTVGEIAVNEGEGDDIDERLKKLRLSIEEKALNMEERIEKMKNTLAQIKQWRIRKSLCKTPVSADQR